MANLKATTQPDSNRSSDSSDPPSTPEQHRKIRRPSPYNDDLNSLGSYTRTKPIPKKDKKVEELKLQHEYEIKSLRAEVEGIRADQRWLQTEVSSIQTQNTIFVPRKGSETSHSDGDLL